MTESGAEADAQAAGGENKRKSTLIAAGIIGNVMEWYDFAVYGYFATVIGHIFFPSADPAVSVIAAFGAFAAGFLVRPLGGLVFGRIGDKFGRKRALLLSVMAMAVPTTLIAVMPGYETLGIAAPILIVLLRIVQGLSVGGEYTGSIVFLAEQSKPQHRAFVASWALFGAVAGILLGSGVGDILTNLLTEDQVKVWGWRLPFAFGALVAVTGIVIRRHMHAPEPEGLSKTPVRDSFGKHRKDVLRVALLNIGQGVAFYAAFVYAVTYIKEIDKLPSAVAFNINTGAMLVLLIAVPVMAWVSDRVGRKPMMLLGGAILAFGAYPLFLLIHTSNPWLIFLGEAGFAMGLAVYSGGVVGANSELMPKAVRCTGLSFAYNAAVGWFGGTTPLVAAWLILATGDSVAPALWIAGAGLVSLLAVIFMVRETYREQIV